MYCERQCIARGSDTHCYGLHSLNLSVQEAIKGNKILRDTLDTVEEMAKLIFKKSPRRQVIFEKVKNDIGLDVTLGNSVAMSYSLDC